MIPYVSVPTVQSSKRKLLITGVTAYAVYVLACIVLMAILPRPSGALQWLVSFSVLVCVVVVLLLLAIGAIAFLRIRDADVDISIRQKALIKIGIAVAPGLIMSIIPPLMIIREPRLPIDLISPVNPQDIIAPLPVTFSVERAVNILQKLERSAMKYEWDFDGDKNINQETVQPEVTAVYDREGVFDVAVRIILNDGTTRMAYYRLIVQQSVFKLTPSTPIKEKPVVFSLSHLVDEPEQIVQVSWDFDSDGKVDEISKTAETSYTYFRTGRFTVTATMQLQNQSQLQFERSFVVEDPPPLPFPVTVITDPVKLISPAPFSVLFNLDTEEPIGQVQWEFGDQAQKEGERVAHTFEQVGLYPVITKIRSKSGALAEIITVVRVATVLQIDDLTFEGSNTIVQETITGQVPLHLTLTPKTLLRNIEFTWEAPDATEVGSVEKTLQAIYRREGTYTIVLIAEDAEHRAMRLPVKIIVLPPEAAINFLMEPKGGVAPLTVSFDASATVIPGEEITGFEWNFDDETAGAAQNISRGSAHATHTFKRSGTYKISLKVRTVSGKNEGETDKVLVVREPLLHACAFPSRMRGNVPLEVRFDATCSTGAADYLWNFGDDSSAKGESVVHIFETPGSFTITLRVRDGDDREDFWTEVITVTESSNEA